jgi:hypothetical protein
MEESEKQAKEDDGAPTKSHSSVVDIQRCDQTNLAQNSP